MLIHNCSVNSCARRPTPKVGRVARQGLCLPHELGRRCPFLHSPNDHPLPCLSFLSRAISTQDAHGGFTEHRNTKQKHKLESWKALQHHICISLPEFVFASAGPSSLFAPRQKGQGGKETFLALDSGWLSICLMARGLPSTILRRLLLIIAHIHSLKCSEGVGPTFQSQEGC